MPIHVSILHLARRLQLPNLRLKRVCLRIHSSNLVHDCSIVALECALVSLLLVQLLSKFSVFLFDHVEPFLCFLNHLSQLLVLLVRNHLSKRSLVLVSTPQIINNPLELILVLLEIFVCARKSRNLFNNHILSFEVIVDADDACDLGKAVSDVLIFFHQLVRIVVVSHPGEGLASLVH
jgi:hypothetical protein